MAKEQELEMIPNATLKLTASAPSVPFARSTLSFGGGSVLGL